MAKKKSREQLLLGEWIRRLGLHDWAIVLYVNCDPDEMKVPDSVGCTSWEESTKSAYIQIVDPEKVRGLTRPFSFEQILVHELLHLKTAFLSSKDDEETLPDRLLHQLIDDIARALVDAKQYEQKKENQ